MKFNAKKAITLILIVLLLLSVFSLSGFTVENQKISPHLNEKIKTNNTSNIPVIVLTQNGLKEKHELKVGQVGGKLKHNLSIINGFCAEVPASSVKEIARDTDIVMVLEDGEVEASLDTATPAINAPAAWSSGYTGKGITVAVLYTEYIRTRI